MLQTIGKYFKNLSEEFDSFETLIFSYFYLPCPENIQKQKHLKSIETDVSKSTFINI